MITLLLKVTLLLSIALVSLPLLRRSSAAMRHLICAMALSGVLILPLTLVFTPPAIAIHVPVTFTITAASSASPTFSFVRFLLDLWMTGSALLMVRLAVGYWRVGRVLRTSEPRDSFLLADVSVPIVCGLFRPFVLLPRNAEAWPLNQRAAAIRHERAHIERKDLFTSLIAHLACAVYWFHPLVWAVARQLRHEQETACDDAVLSSGFEPANYAEALVATAQQLTSTSLIGCHMLTHQTLKNRIARLLDYSLPRTSSTNALRRAALLSLAVCATIGLIYAVPQNPAVPQDAKEQQTEKVYKMAEGITSPRVINKIEPAYTEEARAAKISGTVVLSLVVGADGMAHNINVVNTPDDGLGAKAVEAVQQWKFQPATKDGEAIALQAQIEVNFKIK